MVLNDTVCIVKFMRRTAAFYAHESCGKCTPCREGTRWMVKIFDRILAGAGAWKTLTSCWTSATR